MNSDELLIPEEQLPRFKDDSVLVGKNTEKFIKELYPYLLLSDDDLSNIPIEKNSTSLLEGIKFFRIESCTIEAEAGDSDFEYLKGKINKFLSAVYFMNVPVCYGIIGCDGKTSVVLGIDPNAETGDNAESIKKIIQGLLPDISISDYSYKENGKIDFGVIGGVPSSVIEGKRQSFDYSSLARALNGKDYSFLVIARPVQYADVQNKINVLTQLKDSCLAVSKRNVSMQEGIAKTKGVTKSESVTDGTSVSAYVGGAIGPVVVGGSVGYNHSETKSLAESVSDTISNGKSLGLEIQNGFALDLAKRAENAVARMQKGLAAGFWQTAICFSTNEVNSTKILQGCLYGEIAKPNPFSLPPRIIDCNGRRSDENQSLIIPKNIFDMKKNVFPNLCSFSNTEELSLLFSFPDKNVPGYELKTGIRYPISPKTLASGDGDMGVELGSVCDGSAKLDNIPFSLSFEDLNKHTFVCGITGSGKTNSVKHILSKADKPFWVIECAKKEYRRLGFPDDQSKNPVVFTLGRPEINCISFNPFYIMRGISPQMHIDFLKDLFNASFSFYGPMPYIFEKCLHNVYLKRGWNLSMGCHPYFANTGSVMHFFGSDSVKERYGNKEHKFVFPTMYDLKNEIEEHVNSMSYEGELKSNIKTAILARLESLCVGAKGFMLNTSEPPNFDSWLKKNVIFELEGLADDSDKAFTVGILIIYLTEYRMYEKEISPDSQTCLKHLLVIEEAHRLLKNISTEKTSEDLGNPKGKAIEHFTNMIAEMRSYGQGVIISEQIPTKIAPDVIKNSSNKIIHRIVAKDDQKFIANMIGMNNKDAVYLGDQLKGRALCHTEGMRLPISVEFPKVAEIGMKDGDLRYKLAENNNQDFYILKSLLLPYLLKIDAEIPKLLNSFLTLKSENIKESIVSIKKTANAVVKSVEPHLRNAQQYDDAVASILSELIIKYLFSGVYYVEKLPEKMIERLEKVILNPYDVPIASLCSAFSEIDNNNDTVADAVTELALNYFYTHKGREINTNKLIASYFITVDDNTISGIGNKIQERKKAYC
jgi:hypothetical protein